MMILEVLKNYHNLKLQNLSGDLPSDVKVKLDVLEKLFSEAHDFSFALDEDIQILKLHYICGMTFEAIAERLSLSVRTVYRRRDDAIIRLQKYVFKEI